MSPSLLLLQTQLSGGRTEHFMALQTSFPIGSIPDMCEASKVNYFAADRD